MSQVVVVVSSFGFSHCEEFIDRQHVVYDVRQFRDPLRVGGLRDLTGRDESVRTHVLATPGVAELISMIARNAAEYVKRFGTGHRIAIGCGGGRHRAPVIASEVAEALNQAGLGAVVEHRDIDKPVLDAT